MFGITVLLLHMLAHKDIIYAFKILYWGLWLPWDIFYVIQNSLNFGVIAAAFLLLNLLNFKTAST